MDKFWEIFWSIFSIVHCVMIVGGWLTMRSRLAGLRQAELMLTKQKFGVLDLLGVTFATWYLWPFFMMGHEWPVRVIAPELTEALKKLLERSGHSDHVDLNDLRKL